MAIGALFFAAPLALLAFLALPALYWLIRATPPAPAEQAFAPLRLLLGLSTDEALRKRAPWWLLLVRAILASLLILGFAQPSWRPKTAPAPSTGPVLIVLDDGWTSAPDWASARGAALQAVDEAAQRKSGPFFLLASAAQRAQPAPLDALSAPEIKARLTAWRPSPWRPDRAGAAKRIKQFQADTGRRQAFAAVFWISDGLDSPGSAQLGEALTQMGPLRVHAPNTTARAITGLLTDADGLEIEIRRASTGHSAAAIAAETLQGRSLGATEIRFAPNSDIARARIALPPAIAARAARVRLVGEASAGGVRLAPNGAGRPLVGLVEGAQTAQPFLSDLFYIEKAIAPFASVQSGDIESLLGQGVQAVVLADDSVLPNAAQSRLEAWLEGGGLLIRFAGPRLANAELPLVPSPLRRGTRALGGALTWELPQEIAAFPPESPFADLKIPADLRVRRQVLADPASLYQASVWARLKDGTPIVTAAQRGRGLLVLFHVTGGPAWSDLALSGLFVDMLRETLAFSGKASAAAQGADTLGPWSPVLLFDGFGALAPPRRRAQIPNAFVSAKIPGPDLPPGLYERPASPQMAVSAASEDEILKPLALPAKASSMGEARGAAVSLSGVFLGLAGALAACDLLLALALAGRLAPKTRAAIGAGLLALGCWAQSAPSASAQIQVGPPPGWGLDVPLAPPEVAGIGDVRLAFLRTGDVQQDRATRAGLEALSATLYERTAVEPGPVAMLDAATDDLSLYPLLFWSAPSRPAPLSAAAAARLERYMQLGGLLFIDTRGLTGASGEGAGPAAILLQGVNAPPLELIEPRAHVLGKTFYLLRGFTGKRNRAIVWAESANASAARDGVASLIIGDGDWASMWADTRPLTADEAVKRELSLRFGVNLVMMALTGNYKSDQVHLQELLTRLGGNRGKP